MLFKVCYGNVPFGAHYHFMPFTSLSDPIKSHFCSSIVNSHHCRQVSVLYFCTLYWPHIKQLQPTNPTCVAGWLGRWEGSAEEMDDLPEGSTLVLSARWWLPLQHNPRHVCADTQPRGLEEHCVLWSLHISVVRTNFYRFDTTPNKCSDILRYIIEIWHTQEINMSLCLRYGLKMQESGEFNDMKERL